MFTVLLLQITSINTRHISRRNDNIMIVQFQRERPLPVEPEVVKHLNMQEVFKFNNISACSIKINVWQLSSQQIYNNTVRVRFSLNTF